MDSTAVRLVPNSNNYHRDPRRYFVVLIFFYLSFNQCLIWLTFSPIARSAEIYYHIDEFTVDLLLNWGPIIFLPCLPLTYILLNKSRGLQKSVRLLAVADLVAALIRLIPLMITKPTDENFGRISLLFLHLGQILNAACGPLVMAPVSHLSCLWFPPEERTRATTIAIFAGNFGSTVGFLISPWIVSSPESIPHLLYVHLALTFLACILALFFFPSYPRSPPSAAAELLLNNFNNEQSRISLSHVWSDLKICFTHRSFLLIAGAGGLLSGTFSIWTSLFDEILKEEHFTEQQAGWFSFGSSIAGILGGLVSSSLADTSRFQHSLKLLMSVSLTGCFLAVCWFQLSVATLFSDRAILPSNAITIGVSTALAGLFSGAALPLVYEALSELMFPLPESLSASILVQWLNVIAVIFLFLAPNRSKFINFLVVIVLFCDVLMILCAHFTYQRRDEDHRRRIENDQQVNDDVDHSQYGSID